VRTLIHNASSNIKIRKAIKQDAKSLLSLFEKHALHEGQTFKHSDADISNKVVALQNLVDTPLIIFVVTKDNLVKGYMSVVKQFSTWDMHYYLYMDCLYLLPELRGEGLGKTLMNVCKGYAHEQNLTQIQWQTPVENIDAIDFYNHIGAKAKHKQRFFWDS